MLHDVSGVIKLPRFEKACHREREGESTVWSKEKMLVKGMERMSREIVNLTLDKLSYKRLKAFGLLHHLLGLMGTYFDNLA